MKLGIIRRQGALRNAVIVQWNAGAPQALDMAQASAAQERPGEAQRHGRAYREIFQIVRSALNAPDTGENDDNADESTP